MKTGLFLIIGLIVLTSICDTISQICLKTTINSLGEFSSRHLINVLRFILKLILKPKAWLALVFSTLSLIIWLLVLSKADLNFAFSVDSMHYIFIALGSSLLLKEKVGGIRWMGTFSIVVGIILVTIS
ncbi:MAG: hypothetical protein NTZ92_03150 [Candidatus Omnitrophica bacterium]|nr:hypothetical protein [Candidatus Omnitrophota bacterium]